MGKTKRTKGIIVTIGVLVSGAWLVSLMWPFFYPAYQARHFRTQLLCKTDHQALLEACRELTGRVASGKLKAAGYSVRFSPDPEVSQFPEVIRALQPRYVIIYDDGQVRIDMGGGLDVFGVRAYPDDYRKPYPNFKYGDRELVKGLWYYDEFYKFNNEYDRKIDALLRKRDSGVSP